MSEKQTAKATVAVSRWEPRPYDELDGAPTLVHIDGAESFCGDIAGEGTFTFLQILAADGSASFVGLERVTGSIGDRAGSFVLQDQGTLTADGTVSGTWSVVAGSGTGDLVGLRGDGGFQAKLGQHAEVFLDYVFN